jgi:hypothetical protein
MTATDPADGPRTQPTGADASTRASELAGAPTSAPGASTEQQAADAVAAAWQQHWSRLIALVIGQYARPDLAEDAVSDAFESAARRWPLDGVPANTGAWLLTAARRRVLDRLRTESVQRRKAPLMVVDDEMRAAASAAVDPVRTSPTSSSGSSSRAATRRSPPTTASPSRCGSSSGCRPRRSPGCCSCRSPRWRHV